MFQAEETAHAKVLRLDHPKHVWRTGNRPSGAAAKQASEIIVGNEVREYWLNQVA